MTIGRRAGYGRADGYRDHGCGGPAVAGAGDRIRSRHGRGDDRPAEPDVAEAVKLLPVQDAALVEFHDRVEDCPELMVFGLAERAAVVAGGGMSAARAAQLPQRLSRSHP
jgi:hypothetical protein